MIQPDLPRKERERLRQREQMLAAALDLFSEKGYHNVSMHEIAQKAEFAIGTLYKYFENKEDLYKGLVREVSDQFHTALVQAITEPDDVVEKLRNYIKVKGAVFRKNAPFIKIFFAETQGVSFNIRSGLDRELRERYTRFLDRIALIFESGMKQGRFKRIAEPYPLAVALDSICNGFLSFWLESPERHPFPEDPNVILDILFKGLLNE